MIQSKELVLIRSKGTEVSEEYLNRAFDKVVKVIRSCESPLHLNTARNLIDIFVVQLKKHDIMNWFDAFLQLKFILKERTQEVYDARVKCLESL